MSINLTNLLLDYKQFQDAIQTESGGTLSPEDVRMFYFISKLELADKWLSTNSTGIDYREDRTMPIAIEEAIKKGMVFHVQSMEEWELLERKYTGKYQKEVASEAFEKYYPEVCICLYEYKDKINLSYASSGFYLRTGQDVTNASNYITA